VQNQKNKKIQQYLENPKRCLGCNIIISYEKRCNNCCSRACGAMIGNKKRDLSKIKLGPPKGVKPKDFIPYTKVKQCVICQKYHPRAGETCSKPCKIQLLSKRVRERIYHGFNPNQNRGRHKKSWLESSFEAWLVERNVTNFVMEQSFKRLDQVKTYFADFYFPDLKLIIELDGTQHKYTKEYDQERDNYISSTYGIEVIRISHKEYQKGTKVSLIESKLGIS
jgi:very-short-patch-repair endonuclease